MLPSQIQRQIQASVQAGCSISSVDRHKELAELNQVRFSMRIYLNMNEALFF